MDEQQNDKPVIPDDPFVLLFPPEPAPGILAALARQSRLEEIKQHEQSKVSQVWTVRGIISDSVPLSGAPHEVIQRRPHNLLFLNEDPLSIYLHSGGRQAIYYDLVGDECRKLNHIEVRVESRLPSNAIMLARRPLNALLDVLTRDYDNHVPLPLLDDRFSKPGRFARLYPRSPQRSTCFALLCSGEQWSGCILRLHGLQKLQRW